MDAEVVVIGAGAAGLAAARALVDAGRAVVVLEAADAPGGRIRTVRPGAGAAALELGAEFVHGDAPSTLRWLRAARAEIEPMPDPDGDERDRTTRWEAVGRLLSTLDPGPDPDRDQSVADALAAAGDRPEVGFLRAYLTGYDALDPERASTRAVVIEEGGEATALRSVRVPVGQDRIVAALLGAGAPIDLRTRCRVHRVEHGGDRVQVEAVGPLGRPVTVAAERVVVTLPIGVLRCGTVSFDPPLQMPLGVVAAGAAVRVTLSFEPKFFAEHLASAGFRLDTRAGAYPTFWTAAGGVPAMIAWAGGPHARELTAQPMDERIARAVTDLSEALDLPEASLIDHLQGWYHHDWVSDPLAQGAYSYLEVGGVPAHLALGKPQGRLVLAGEHVATAGVTSSTVEAALRSGERAAAWIARAEPAGRP
jgi:monoamine oxidase